MAHTSHFSLAVTEIPTQLSPAKAKLLREIQDATFESMLKSLGETGMCNVERPTGFGKTRLFMKLAKRFSHMKMLYIFDTKATKAMIIDKYSPTNVDFISYAAISYKVSQQQVLNELLQQEYQVIVFDESHLMGGANTSWFCEQLITNANKTGTLVLGGTATPLRTDFVDVTETYFNNNTTFTYTLEDAFRDGLIEMPLYSVMLYSTQRIKEDLKLAQGNIYLTERLKQLEYAYMKRLGASKIYRNKVEQLYSDIPDYMKFIVFYPTIKSLKENSDELLRDFQEAFPNHVVELFPVSSDPDHFDDCTEIDRNVAEGKHIDLIVCIDMLNQGYHSDSLTGIIMNRATMSNIVYTQQLGRCLSVTSNHRAVVFDNVANCNIDPLASLAALKRLLESEETGSRRRKTGFARLALNVDAEDLEIAEWYQRIKSTKNVTANDLEKARKLYNVVRAKPETVSKLTRVPEWLLREELAKDGCQ